jgi:predicted Zn-dependent protease
MKLRLTHRKHIAAAGSLAALGLVAALVPFNMGGCSASNVPSVQTIVNSATKAGKAMTLSEKDERNMGQSVAMAVTTHYGLSNDEGLNRYVTLVGLTVASTSSRPDLQYVFGVLESGEVNAFSGPGGYVMITRGALARMRDESELAGVLSHEIGHIVRHHGLDAVRGAGLIDAGKTLAQGSDWYSQFGEASDVVVDGVTKKGFTQQQEFDADTEGVKIVTAAGYDPNGLLRFLQRLNQEKGKGGSDLFSTHPGLGERIQRVRSQIAQGKVRPGATLKERFEANVPKTQ